MRAHFFSPAIEKPLIFLFKSIHTADTGSDENANSVEINVVEIKFGVRYCFITVAQRLPALP